MPKVKLPRKPAHVDMTAMCDVAFLLLTFFILATKPKAAEPVVIRTPSSTSTTVIPNNYILITMSQDGKVFFDVDNQNTRREIINKINDDKNLGLNAQQIQTFVEMSGITVPFNQLSSYLSMEHSARMEYDKSAPGIPTDTTDNYQTNELAYWIKTTRYSMPKARIAIKADGDAPYPEIQKVIGTLGKQQIYRFSFITDTKGVPVGTALAEQQAVASN